MYVSGSISELSLSVEITFAIALECDIISSSTRLHGGSRRNDQSMVVVT